MERPAAAALRLPRRVLDGLGRADRVDEAARRVRIRVGAPGPRASRALSEGRDAASDAAVHRLDGRRRSDRRRGLGRVSTRSVRGTMKPPGLFVPYMPGVDIFPELDAT